jgi:transcriptional regulator with XRE-family HTH domain
MTEEKRKRLKSMIKMSKLSELSGTELTYLSRIINNQSRPSAELAEELAKKANQIMFAQKLAEIASQLVIEDEFTAEDFLK